MKKNKTLLLLAAVFIALVAIYFLLQGNAKKQEEKEKQKALDAQIMVTSMEGLSSISYTYEDNEFAFHKEGDTWYYTKDKAFPLDQTYLTAMEDTFTKLHANRELSGGDTLKDYGLETPAYTVHLKDTSGKEQVLYIGDAVNEDYYLTLSNKEKIYTVSQEITTDISHPLNDMIQKESIPSISTGNLIKISITEKGAATVYTKEQADALAACGGGFGAFAFDECVSYSAAADELTNFGLDPSNRITLEAVYTDTEEEEQLLTLNIGAKDTAGTSYYVQLKDSPMVYKAKTEIVDHMMNKN